MGRAYRIGSFNLCNFNEANSSSNKNLINIADIIKAERMDVVGIQEIYNRYSMERLKKALGYDWEGSWESPESISSIAAEGYAFLWNTKSLNLVKSKSGQPFRPRIIKQYKASDLTNRTGNNRLLRDPYYIRLSPVDCIGGTPFEIRLINTHIRFGKGQSEDGPGEVDQRRGEYLTLVKDIYAMYSDRAYDQISEELYSQTMPIYTVLLGDYNLNLPAAFKKYGLNSRLYRSEILINEGRNEKIIIAAQEELTSLKKAADDKAIGELKFYANNYDHFSYDKKRYEDVTVNIMRVDALRTYYGGDLDRYQKEISDHVPIIFELSLDNR